MSDDKQATIAMIAASVMDELTRTFCAAYQMRLKVKLIAKT